MQSTIFRQTATATVILLFFLALSITSYAQISKSKLNVLYVGGTGNFYEIIQKYPSAEAKEADIKRRMASFEGMLKRYFDKVTVVHARDYKAELSSGYDVTVMDGVPGSRMYAPDFDPKKDRLLAEKVNVLPYDFSSPMLFIGETGVNLGTNIGLRFDWYCLCLRAEALNMKSGHEIFKGPFPVKITTNPQPLPMEAKIVNFREDKTYPSPIPMWKVQTKSYDDRGSKNEMVLRPGLICHAGGFDDSPDGEYISGGSSAKGAGAVALGRHGNFFHWGFAASPEFMTEEGITVLTNAIVYISKFKGKPAIARKLAGDVKTTYDIIEQKSMASVKANDLINEYYVYLAKQMQENNQNTSAAPKPQSFDSYLRANFRELYPRYGADLKAYHKYYDENMPYFYSDKGRIVIDEDLKSLKINKKDPKVLDAAIRLWESGQDIEKAKRILDRYTLAPFSEPEEWRKWYNENKSRMFFTESGGYYFLINSYDKNIEGNDYRKKQKQSAYKAISPGETTDESPVSVAVGSVRLDNGNKEIVVRLKIHPSYHIYSYVSEKDPFIKTEIKINPPAGYKAVGEMKSAKPILYNPSGTSVYKDEAVYTLEVQGSGAGEAVCKISYQCCNDNICYPPEEKELKVKI